MMTGMMISSCNRRAPVAAQRERLEPPTPIPTEPLIFICIRLPSAATLYRNRDVAHHAFYRIRPVGIIGRILGPGTFRDARPLHSSAPFWHRG